MGRRLVVIGLLGAFPIAAAAAQVRVENTPSVSIPALARELALAAPARSLSAGAEFIRDDAAQSWLAANRPERFPDALATAFSLNDLEETLSAHDDPRYLRSALLSRSRDSVLARDPARLLDAAARTENLASKRPLFEKAVLDWSSFDVDARHPLETFGYTREQWASMTLPERVRAVRSSYEALVTLSPGNPAYAAQYEKTTERLRPFLTDDEIDERSEHLKRAKRLAEGLRRAQAAAANAGSNAQNAELLGWAQDVDHLGSAETALGRLSTRLGFALPEPERPAYDLTDEETWTLRNRLGSAIRHALRGSALGEQLWREAADSGLSLRVEGGSSGKWIAIYLADAKEIRINPFRLAELLSGLGRTPRDLLTDDEALADAAVIYSHVYVHEAIHNRQHLWAEVALPTGSRRLNYHWHSEMESVNAQAAFLAQKRAADPAFAAREARLRAAPGLVGKIMALPEANAADSVRMNKWLTRNYSEVPTLARAGARMIRRGIGSGREYARFIPDIDAELARRTRRPLVERLRLEKQGRKAVDFWSDRAGLAEIATSELRGMRIVVRDQALRAIKFAKDIQRRAENPL